MNTDISPAAIGKRWFQEVWQQHNSVAIMALTSPDVKGHLEGGQEIEGPAEFIIFHQQLLAALPDLQLEVLHLLGDEQQVWVHWKATGTHTGQGLGTKATRRPLTFSGMSLFRVVNGRIVEGWDCWNQAQLLTQMRGLA